MDCDHMHALINHYMDGGLSQWRMRAVSRHLDDCPPCYDGYRVHVDFRQVVATKCVEEAPYNLRSRIEAALAAQPAATLGGGSGFEVDRDFRS